MEEGVAYMMMGDSEGGVQQEPVFINFHTPNVCGCRQNFGRLDDGLSVEIAGLPSLKTPFGIENLLRS